MADVAGDWVGKILGTNNADIFVEIFQVENQLSGLVRINDALYGTSVYAYRGLLDGLHLMLEGDPTPECLSQRRVHTAIVNGRSVQVETPVVTLGHVSVNATLTSPTRIDGKWASSIGTGGTFWATRAIPESSKVTDKPEAPVEEVAFIMMSISPNDPYSEDALAAIKRAAGQHGIEAIRVDEIEHSKRITDVILEKLRTARFLICDITNERPNVYYELGYAHGIGKEVILVAREGTAIHFDIKDYNIIIYKSYSDLEARVAKRLALSLSETV